MQRARETRAHGGECEMRRWLAQRPYTNTEQSTAAEAREEMFRACAPRRSEIFACLGREAAERAAVFVVALGVWALDRCSCASFMLFVAPRPASSFIAHRSYRASRIVHHRASRIVHHEEQARASAWVIRREELFFVVPSSVGVSLVCLV